MTTLLIDALLAPFLFRMLGRRSFYLMALGPAAVFCWLLAQAPHVLHEPLTVRTSWLPQIGADLDFRLDALSLTLALMATGIGALVLAYCAQYFAKAPRTAVGQAMFAGQLTGFAAAMFALVTADSIMLLFIAWEATTVLSYLMIGFSRTRLSARRSSLQALVITAAGGLAMLVGLLMLAQATGTSVFSEMLSRLGAGQTHASTGFLAAAGVCVFAGIAAKSALVPMHFWLPGAMAAPTPVSAYLHAAAMVKAGIYLLLRFAPAMEPLHLGGQERGGVILGQVPLWELMATVFGAATMLLGGYRALRQYDLKLILAYGTVSQLGFLTLAVGTGEPDYLHAVVALMLAHALFKATLFLVTGIIDQRSGTRDIRELAGLARHAPLLFATALIAAASMAGLPPTFGFVAKEAVLQALWDGSDTTLGAIRLVAAVVGSVLTLAYTARFVFGAFGDGRFFSVTAARYIEPIRASFLTPALLLAALSLAFGPLPQPLDALAHAAGEPGQTSGLPESAHAPEAHLALWHGLSPALGLTALILVLGTLLIWQKGAVARAQDALSWAPPAEKLFRRSIDALDVAAVSVTGATQRGSVRFYVGVILAAAAVVPVSAMLTGARMQPLGPLRLYAADSPAQVIASGIIIISVLAAARAGKRFLAVMMVSVSGFGMAALFALQGAPDLALTQVLVDTVMTVAVVLALRVLPPKINTAGIHDNQALRLLLGAAVAAAMVVLAVAAMNARSADPVSLAFPHLAYEGGGGRNIVNVALVDLRAWDTFGEVSVLAVAATGVASLIFVKGRGDRRFVSGFSSQIDPGGVAHGEQHESRRVGDHFRHAPASPWISAGHTLEASSRSVLLEVVVRLIFHTLVLVALYLLLAGHNLPGGGFAAGLVAGLALAVRYFAGGRYELYEAMPVSAGTMLGLGMLVLTACALLPLLFGGQALQGVIVKLDFGALGLGWLGEHKLTSSLFFDIGVVLIVVGLVADVLRSFGSRLDWLAARTNAGEEST